MADNSKAPSAPPPASYGATGTSQPPYPVANPPYPPTSVASSGSIPYPPGGNPPYPVGNAPYPTPAGDPAGSATNSPPTGSGAPYPPPTSTQPTEPSAETQNTAAAAAAVASSQYPQPGQQASAAIPSEPPPKYEDIAPGASYPTGYPQQPYPAPGLSGYQAAPATYPVQQQPTIVIGGTGGKIFGQFAQTMECPHCQATITTSVNHVTGGITWVAAGLLCLFCCWPCACIPFCTDSLKDVMHQCPNCNKVLGTYHRL